MDLIMMAVAVALFEFAAWRWGADSTDTIDNPEWERRAAESRRGGM